MVSRFSVRFVIAVFGGAAAGLLVGVILRFVFGDDDLNVFAVMPWGIMAGALGLAFAQTRVTQKTRDSDGADGSRQHP
jgi:Na+/citrate or Na+/malate symporter